MNDFRVYLRALEVDDHVAIHEWRKEEYYHQGVISVKRFSSLDTERRWIENAIKEHEALRSVRLGVVQKSDDNLVGIVFLKSIDLISRQASEGIFLGLCRGIGYSSEARILNLKYAFYDLGLERVTSRIIEGNLPSIKSAERAGFQREGLLRHAAFKDGRFLNVAIYSMLNSEFIERYGSRFNPVEIEIPGYCLCRHSLLSEM